MEQKGYDCSGLVLRAVQLAGIRYFCTNTTTARLALQDLLAHEALEVGDLILIYGRVMIVSDPEKISLSISLAMEWALGAFKKHRYQVCF